MVTIPMKLPSLNEIISANRYNKYAGAKLKRDVQNDIAWFINKMPAYNKPIKLHFTWQEANHKRDLDNICGGGRKFILDTMVSLGKIPDDNSNYIVGFSDTFTYGDSYKVTIDVEEIKAYGVSTNEEIQANNTICSKHNRGTGGQGTRKNTKKSATNTH